MPKYLVYTTDGFTQDTSHRETNNCQVVDYDILASSAQDAIDQVAHKHPEWDAVSLHAFPER